MLVRFFDQVLRGPVAGHLRHHPGRVPDAQEQGEASHRDDRGDDVHQPRAMEVRDQVLRDGEADARDQDRRPDLEHAAEAHKRPDQPERDDHREERQLAADHAAELEEVEPGDRGERDHGRAQSTVSHRRGIGDQRQARGRERRKAKSDQHRRRHRNGRAEAGGTLEEGAETEGNEQKLEPTVVADVADASLQDVELALFVGELVEEDDVENDPADREQAEGGAIDGGHRRHAAWHAEDEDRDQQGGGEAEQRGEVRLHFEDADRAEQDDHRNCGQNGRDQRAAGRIVHLAPDLGFHEVVPCIRRRGLWLTTAAARELPYTDRLASRPSLPVQQIRRLRALAERWAAPGRARPRRRTARACRRCARTRPSGPGRCGRCARGRSARPSPWRCTPGRG